MQVGGGVLESCKHERPSMNSPWLLLKASFLLLRTQGLCQELEVYRPAASGHASPVAHTCIAETQEPPREGSCHNMAPWQKPGVAFDLSQPTGAALWTYLVSYLERIEPRELSTGSRHLQGFFTFWQRRAAGFCSVCFAVWILFSN